MPSQRTHRRPPVPAHGALPHFLQKQILRLQYGALLPLATSHLSHELRRLHIAAAHRLTSFSDNIVFLFFLNGFGIFLLLLRQARQSLVHFPSQNAFPSVARRQIELGGFSAHPVHIKNLCLSPHVSCVR